MTQVMNLCLFGSALNRFEDEHASKHYPEGREDYSFSGVLGMKLIDLHKRYIEWWQRKLGISDYALLWLSFFKGILIALLVIWLVK